MALTQVSPGLLDNQANAQGFRNRIINGDMRIAQRGTAAVTVNASSDFYPVDRFHGRGQGSDGVFTVQQDSDAPTGFNNSLKAIVTTADASIGATQFYVIRQAIEGFNVADFGWGTASAKTVTLSFWVRSSLTGTFGGALYNNGGTRSYPFTYSISSADTWEYKTITIAGDTSGTWLTNNGIGLYVNLSLGSGADRLGTANSWAGSFFTGATGETSVIGTLNATFYITGVQLEVGSVATPFERRPYGTELSLCQRYCHAFSSVPLGRTRDGDTVQGPGVYMGTTMRATPTLRSGATFTVSTGSAGTPQIFSPNGGAGSADIVYISSSTSSWTTGALVALTNAVFEAEL